jgi:integrase
MARHLLTDTSCSKAKPKAKPYRLADGDNLYLYVATSGVKSWQVRFRKPDTRKPDTHTIGKYPQISLASARSKADWARAEIDAGRDPNVMARVAKRDAASVLAEKFSKVKDAWLDDEARRQKWTPAYREEVEASLRNHLSELDALPISQVKARITSPILRAILRTAPLMLDKVHRRLRGIMDYAVEEGLIDGNPIPKRRPRVERRHYPAVTNLVGVGDILRRARAADPCKGIQRAHVLLACTAMRVSEVVAAQWPEFDFEAANWSIPRERMKRKDQERGPHVVPIPPALLEQLQEWKTADGEGTGYVCIAPRDSTKHITAEGIEKFYRHALELSGKHSPHSWRSAFSTICRDAGKDPDAIESQLDHIVGNKVAAAYDRAKRLDLRRELMTWYEEKLIAARDGADVLPMRAKVS